MQKIIPNLWFDTHAEEAVNFYTSIFSNSKIIAISRYGESGAKISGQPVGSVLTVDFELEGFRFTALNGGPIFRFNPSISFMVNFDPSREEHAEERLDTVWEKLSEGAEILMPIQEYPFSKRYGWLKDKYGVSWQLILTNPDGEERPVIVPSLLFVGDVCGKAEEAIDYYTSVFKEAKKGIVAKYPAGMEPDKEGTLMFGDFRLFDVWFAAMDSAHEHTFAFNEAISFLVNCDTQEEIDFYFEKLSAIPGSEQCGWVKDKYGVSWQIVPSVLQKLMADSDPEKVERVMTVMLGMKKLDIAALEAAANSK